MTTRTRTNRLGALAIAAALAASLLALTKPAEAAFPGNNGKIVFTSSRVMNTNPTGDEEIYTMMPDGTGLTQLTKNATSDFNPEFSSDGKKIAFVSFRDGNFEVYTMNANGKNPTRLTNNSAFNTYPDWQPLP